MDRLRRGFVWGVVVCMGILVWPGCQPVLPVAAFFGTPTTGEAPLSVQFKDISLPAEEAILAWRWDFGDGATSTDQHPEHTYANIGSYTVRLTITTASGDFEVEKAGYVQTFMNTAAESVVDELQGIVVLCSVPGNGLDPDDRDTLIDYLEEAEAAYLVGEPCEPLPPLDDFLALVQRLYDPGNPLFEELYNRARMVLTEMAIIEGWSCVGHERIQSVADAQNSDPVLLTAASAQALSATVSFPEPRLQTVFIDGEAFTEIQIPGLPLRSGDGGLPGLPSLRRLVAIPIGGDITVTATPNVVESFTANIYPYQMEPVDQEPPEDEEPSPREFADLPFVLDDTTYMTDRFYPSNICQVTALGEIRGMNVVQVEVFCGQYNPVSRALELFDSVDLDIDFSPDPASGAYDYLTETSFSPFESDPGLYTGMVLNAAIVESLPPAPLGLIPTNQGEEFMIITHPNFKDAADALAAWKNEKGLLTKVYQAGTGVVGRESRIEILAFIRDHHDNVIIKPSYLLLLGDAEYIEPWYLPYIGSDPPKTIGSDWPYGRVPGTNEIVIELPRYAMGRIPVDTLDQANTVVDKIITYEKNPPSAPASIQYFYDTVTLAGQFQCCRVDFPSGTSQRTYTEVMEWARARLINRGYAVERIYKRTIDDGDAFADPPVPPYLGDPTPRYYYDGGSLPVDIGPNSGFFWNGDTQDIIDAWNQGRFLMVHRDHGYSSGFINPSFTSTNAVNDLDNGALLPVVFSVNCTSGIFDNETTPDFSTNSTYFAEWLLREEDGAVGILGDTRVSPSWANSALTRGFFDAIWPTMINSFGDNTSRRRLGDILNHGKLYLLTQAGIEGNKISESNVLNEFYMWHVIGDPTLEIWTDDPNPDPLPLGFVPEIGDEVLTVQYAFEDAIITAYQVNPADGEFVPIGRAPVAGGEAELDIFEDPLPGVDIHYSASAENAISIQLEVID